MVEVWYVRGMSTTEATVEPAPRGRPRQFDDDAVIEAVVQLFWRQGYEATSMADVVEATGLNKSSLYNSFGSKDALFRQALETYVDQRATMLTVVLVEGSAGLDDLHRLLDGFWMEIEQGGDHRGCLAVNTSTELGDRDDVVLAIGTRYRTMMRDALTAALTRAADAGEIDPAMVEDYVGVLLSFMLGTAVIVRSGAPDAEIAAQLDAARTIIDSWRT